MPRRSTAPPRERPSGRLGHRGPDGAGHLHLVAVEYVVIQQAWHAHDQRPPALFGDRFDFTASPNRYGLPPFYSLHAWVWKHNPAGTFAMWNPRVSCAAAIAG
jgi:hypothetical protein